MGEDLLSEEVHPVYLLERVARALVAHCRAAVPDEALGKLYGVRESYRAKRYVRIVDWATGEVSAGPTSAQFTERGVRQCELFLDERYGVGSNRPREVGVYHSHPFGVEPQLSATDLASFTSFPWGGDGNVFVLIDPVGDWFKVYVSRERRIVPVEWALYTPSGSGDIP